MSSTKKLAPIQQLKNFGYVMCLVCVLLGASALHKERCTLALASFIVAGIFMVATIFGPETLRFAEDKWMFLAEKMAIVSTFVIVAFLFFFVTTPTGLLAKLMGKRFLNLKPDPKLASYWEPVEVLEKPRYFDPY